jgi:AMMECR1 domain-containing protein
VRAELGEVRIEVSVLSPLLPVSSWRDIEVGRHGIVVVGGGRNGVFLPEVATEMGWTAEEFVKACLTQKALIPESAWPETQLFRFTTEKMTEFKGRGE